MQFWPPDDEHVCSKHVEAWNKPIVKQKFCASSCSITDIKKSFIVLFSHSWRRQYLRLWWSYLLTIRSHNVARITDLHITWQRGLALLLLLLGVLYEVRKRTPCVWQPVAKVKYSRAPHNDVSANDGAHIRRWSHNIITSQHYNTYRYVTIAYTIQYSNMLYRFVA